MRGLDSLQRENYVKYIQDLEAKIKCKIMNFNSAFYEFQIPENINKDELIEELKSVGYVIYKAHSKKENNDIYVIPLILPL